MPHVVLEGSLSVADVAARHAPFAVREADRLVKVDRAYVSGDGRTALLETLVVDRGHTQKFFIQIAARAGGLTVRLEPLTDPEKSPGVKRALALVARRILTSCGGRCGSTNIAEFLADPNPEEEER